MRNAIILVQKNIKCGKKTLEEIEKEIKTGKNTLGEIETFYDDLEQVCTLANDIHDIRDEFE